MNLKTFFENKLEIDMYIKLCIQMILIENGNFKQLPPIKLSRNLWTFQFSGWS